MFFFFQKWLQPVELSQKRLKKAYEVKFCFMQKEISYIRFVTSLLSPWLSDASVSQGSVGVGGVGYEIKRKRTFNIYNIHI